MCRDILCEPVSLPCGHTFCRVCLYRCFHARTYEKVCPLCRAQCVRIVAQIAPNNVLIKSFTEQAFPAAYSKRRDEFKIIMDQWPAPLFIYFSSHFILPFQAVTITFTERRYLEMIKRLDKRSSSSSNSSSTTTAANESVQQEKAFLLLPPAQMKRGDIGIVVVIESVSWNAGESEATCRVRADRRCKVMDCWLTDVVDGLHSAQIEPFGDSVSETHSDAPNGSPSTSTAATAALPPAESATAEAASASPMNEEVTSVAPFVSNLSAESRSEVIKKWMDKIVSYMVDADNLSDNQFTGRKNIGKAPYNNPTEMSWWIFRALAFDGAGLQARVPIFLTSSILHSRDPLWRLQVAVQLMQQLLTKLRDPRCKPPNRDSNVAANNASPERNAQSSAVDSNQQMPE